MEGLPSTNPTPVEGAIVMPTDANVDAVGVDVARQNLKANVVNYATQALVQAVEIKGLESITDLDDAGQAELTQRKRELEVAEAKRDAFLGAVNSLPAAPAE